MKRLIAIALASLSIPSLAAAQAAYVSMSFWNVPADPAALIQTPALVAQFPGAQKDFGWGLELSERSTKSTESSRAGRHARQATEFVF